MGSTAKYDSAALRERINHSGGDATRKRNYSTDFKSVRDKVSPYHAVPAREWPRRAAGLVVFIAIDRGPPD